MEGWLIWFVGFGRAALSALVLRDLAVGMLDTFGPTTVIAAAPAFELVSLECADEIMCRPILGWAVSFRL